MDKFQNELHESLERSFGTVPYERLFNQTQSRYIKEKLRQSFIARGNPNPLAYGSTYLDGDGILVINVVDDNKQLKKEIIEALGGARYHINRVTYPWSYLKTIQDVISGYMAHGPKDACRGNLARVGANEKLNKVVVELEDLTDEAIKTFKKNVIDSPALTFRKSRGKAVLYTSPVYLGDEVRRYVTYPTNYFYGSIGYPAYIYDSYTDEYTDGFVTAGHLFPSVNMNAYMGSDVMGKSLSVDYYDGSYSDSALIEITDPFYGISDIVLTYGLAPQFGLSPFTILSNTLCPLNELDEILHKSGVTTELTSGEVTETGISFELKDKYGNVYWTTNDTVEVTSLDPKVAIAGGGDSGGPLFCSNWRKHGLVANHQAYVRLCGITTGGLANLPNPLYPNDPTKNDRGTVGNFSKASNIRSALGV